MSAACSIVTPTELRTAASMNSEAEGIGAVPNASSAPVRKMTRSIPTSGTMPSACRLNTLSRPTYIAVPSLPMLAPIGRTVEAMAGCTPRLSRATRSATGSVAEDDEVEKATASASAIPRKKTLSGMPTMPRISVLCTKTI